MVSVIGIRIYMGVYAYMYIWVRVSYVTIGAYILDMTCVLMRTE